MYETIKNTLVKSGFLIDTRSDISDEIKSLEDIYNIKLSKFIVPYFQQISGLTGVETEHVYLSGIRQFIPIEEALNSCDCAGLKRNTLFVIGNFDDWCWSYVVDITDDNSTAVYTYRDGTRPLRKIAKNIEEFIIMSINSDSSLI